MTGASGLPRMNDSANDSSSLSHYIPASLLNGRKKGTKNTKYSDLLWNYQHFQLLLFVSLAHFHQSFHHYCLFEKGKKKQQQQQPK
jgi:hypothetical protein